MKLCSVVVGALAGAAAASEAMAGAMERLMAEKIREREHFRSQGLFGGSSKYPKVTKRVPCVNGKANGVGKEKYLCNNVDMHGFLSHEDMGSDLMEGNDVWGWTSPDGREFVTVGQGDGTAFVEVVKGGTLRYVGRLPTQVGNSQWRDMKVIDHHVYIGSEAPGHGMQIFDMHKLLDLKEPKNFSIHNDIVWFNGFGTSHNIVANEDSKMIYAVGTKRHLPCKGGLYMIDVSNPDRPDWVGCASSDGYVHDAQCVIYKGPDKRYTGQEICFGYNEDSLTIYDVTHRRIPKIISKTSYNGATYTHQGWLTDSSMKYLLLDDEEDERKENGPAKSRHTTTYIVDITDLHHPKFKGTYHSPVKAIDHNQYVVGDLTYQSNYNSGLRIVNISTVHADPSAKGFKEEGFFDVHPLDDGVGGTTYFMGSWSVYPFFKSGYIVLNSIERGLFSLRFNP